MSIKRIGCALLMLAFVKVQASLPDLIPMRIGHQFGYCDAAMQVVIAPQYEDAQPFGQHGAIVRRDGKYGLIDVHGRWTLRPQLDEIQVGRALRLRKDSRYALADLDGCELSDFCYDAIYELKNGYFLTDRAGRKGLLDVAGRLIVPNRYEHISQLRDNQGNYVDLLVVRDEGLMGIYNTCGERMEFPRFSRIDAFQEGFALVQAAGKFGLVDLEGRQRVACLYDLLLPMTEGLCAAKLKGRWGFIDAAGREVLPFVYEAVQESGFFQGRAAVCKAGTWSFVRRDGEVEFPLDQGYQSLGSLSEGLAAVCKLVEEGGVKYGYVDPEGRLQIPFRYERAEAFKRGFAIVGQRVAKDQSMIKEMRYGIIDRNGRTVIPSVLHGQTEARLKRDSLGYLGFTLLNDGNRRCKIDRLGRRMDCEGNALDVIQRTWMSTRCENAALVAVSRDGLWGFCDGRGRIVIPCTFAAVQCFSDGLARVWPAEGDGSLYYYIDESGRPYYLVD